MDKKDAWRNDLKDTQGNDETFERLKNYYVYTSKLMYVSSAFATWLFSKHPESLQVILVTETFYYAVIMMVHREHPKVIVPSTTRMTRSQGQPIEKPKISQNRLAYVSYLSQYVEEYVREIRFVREEFYVETSANYVSNELFGFWKAAIVNHFAIFLKAWICKCLESESPAIEPNDLKNSAHWIFTMVYYGKSSIEGSMYEHVLLHDYSRDLVLKAFPKFLWYASKYSPEQLTATMWFLALELGICKMVKR